MGQMPTGVFRAPAWLPGSHDVGPSFELGPAPLDLKYGIRAYSALRLSAALLAVVVHFVMAVVTGQQVWWFIVGFALLHVIVLVPYGSSLARGRPLATLVLDGVSMLAGALVVGDPVVVVFWAPMLLLSTLVYLGGRSGQLGVLFTAGMVLSAFGARWVGLIDNQLSGAEIRLYALLSSGAVAAVAFFYLYVVGGSVRHKDDSLITAELATADAFQRADLRASQLESVFDNAPIGLSLQSEDSRFLYVNPAAEEILGLSKEHILEHGAGSALGGVKEWVESEIAAYGEPGRTFRIEYPIKSPDGAEKWISQVGYAHVLEDGLGFVSTLEDLTAQRIATARSRRFASALEATVDLVVIWDGGGTILHTNWAFQGCWATGGDPAGRQLEEVVGKRNADTWTANGDLDDHVAREIAVELPDGSDLSMSLLVLRSKDRAEEPLPVYTAAIRDIAEVVEARRQLEGLLHSKDQFIASVSHELRTPLTAVVGLANELSSNIDQFTHEDVVEFTRIIADQSADLARIVDDLLTVARSDAGVLTVTCRPADLPQLVVEALASLPQGLGDVGDVADMVGLMVNVDGIRVRQIVRNLLTNARRYGGPLVELTISPNGSQLDLNVRDNGDPIPMDDRELMFEAYGRAHHQIGTPDSLGLGLTVSRRLARMMGGDVSYRHDGEWSTFTASFPRSA